MITYFIAICSIILSVLVVIKINKDEKPSSLIESIGDCCECGNPVSNKDAAICTSPMHAKCQLAIARTYEQEYDNDPEMRRFIRKEIAEISSRSSK